MIRHIPNVKTNSNKKAIGINKRTHDKGLPKVRMMISKAKNEKTVSISKAEVMLNGKMIFGRYIFLISPSLLIKDVPDWVTAELKKFQGIMPVNKKTAKVFRSALNNVENTNAMIDIISSGLIRVHKYPSAVRL